jgi:hypothetical protein
MIDVNGLSDMFSALVAVLTLLYVWKKIRYN